MTCFVSRPLTDYATANGTEYDTEMSAWTINSDSYYGQMGVALAPYVQTEFPCQPATVSLEIFIDSSKAVPANMSIYFFSGAELYPPTFDWYGGIIYPSTAGSMSCTLLTYNSLAEVPTDQWVTLTWSISTYSDEPAGNLAAFQVNGGIYPPPRAYFVRFPSEQPVENCWWTGFAQSYEVCSLGVAQETSDPKDLVGIRIFPRYFEQTASGTGIFVRSFEPMITPELDGSTSIPYPAVNITSDLGAFPEFASPTLYGGSPVFPTEWPGVNPTMQGAKKLLLIMWDELTNKPMTAARAAELFSTEYVNYPGYIVHDSDMSTQAWPEFGPGSAQMVDDWDALYGDGNQLEVCCALSVSPNCAYEAYPGDTAWYSQSYTFADPDAKDITWVFMIDSGLGAWYTGEFGWQWKTNSDSG